MVAHFAFNNRSERISSSIGFSKRGRKQSVSDLESTQLSVTEFMWSMDKSKVDLCEKRHQ